MVKNSCVVTLLVAVLTQDSCKQRVNSLPISNKPSSVLSFITPSSSKLYAYVIIHIYYNNMLNIHIYIYIYSHAWLASGFCANMVLPCIHPLALKVSGQQSKFSPNKIAGFRYWLLSPSILGVEQCQKLLKPSKSGVL